MDIYLADKIFHKYAQELSQSTIYHPISALKDSNKDIFLKAIKIYIGYVWKNPVLSKEQFEQLTTSLLFIDNFVPDIDAKRLNKIFNQKQLKKKIKKSDEVYYNNYQKKISKDRINSIKKYHDSVIKFVRELQKLDINSSNYCKRVYELSNVEYNANYDEDFNIKK